MPTLTLLGAFKTLSHHLQLYRFPECEDARPIEAFLLVRAKLQSLREAAELQTHDDEGLLRECQDEFQFLELVLVRVRTFVDLNRPLQPIELSSAMSAMQFLVRRLTVPYQQWQFNEGDSPELVDLLVRPT